MTNFVSLSGSATRFTTGPQAARAAQDEIAADALIPAGAVARKHPTVAGPYRPLMSASELEAAVAAAGAAAVFSA